MAVDEHGPQHAAKDNNSDKTDFGGRHVAIAGNVLFTVLVATAIVVLLQWGAYYADAKVDMTSSGVNSLSAGTQRLLDTLQDKVRLTSLYFQTDLEEPDQAKYRSKVNDLLELYQSANRANIEVEHINPLQDFAKKQRLVERLQGLERFSNELAPYREAIARFRDTYLARMGELVQSDIDRLVELQDQAVSDVAKDDLSQVQSVLDRWQRQISQATVDINELVDAPQPQFRAAASSIANLYSSFSRDLGAISNYAEQLLTQRTGLSESTKAFLSETKSRYQDLIDDLNTEAETARGLPPLELDAILRQLRDTGNAIVVETTTDAKVVGFADVWPPIANGGMGGNARFSNRLFKGEDKITAAMLKLTHKEQTAVTFVRYAGPPLFFGGMPGQRMPAPYAQLKQVLEDANFVVNEWDVSSTDSPPEVDPPPTRTIYVVLRPNQPPRGPMAQTQQAPFSDANLATVRAKLGDNPRAIFLAGWEAGPFGTMPAPYPYGDYLSDEWGISVDANTLVIRAIGIGPGRFGISRQSLSLSQFEPSDHLLVKSMQGKVAQFPFVAPLNLVDDRDKSIVIDTLLRCAPAEGLWGVRDLNPYIEAANNREPINKMPDDLEGPFNVAMAATKGDGKIVVISSATCMVDQIAMAPAMVLTSEGFTLRQRNPGNVALFLNALHWLNDKEDWMDVGRPVDFGTLDIAEGPGLTFIRTFVSGIWPGIAVCCGVVAWWVRRR